MRFYTVPDAGAARNSVTTTRRLSLASLPAHASYRLRGGGVCGIKDDIRELTRPTWRADVSRNIGQQCLLLHHTVSFATILAVVAGLTLSGQQLCPTMGKCGA